MPTTAGLVHLARARRQTAQTFTGVAALALPAMLFEIDAILASAADVWLRRTGGDPGVET